MARSRARADAGMVTAELATALTALVLVLVLSLSALVAGVDLIRCTDAARVGARAAARGDDPQQVRALVLEAAPDGATVTVADRGQAQVEVTVRSRPRGPVGVLVGSNLSARAVAVREGADAP